MCLGSDGRQIFAQHTAVDRQAPRPVPTIQGHSGDVHVSPGVFAAFSGEERGSLGRYEEAHGANGPHHSKEVVDLTSVTMPPTSAKAPHLLACFAIASSLPVVS